MYWMIWHIPTQREDSLNLVLTEVGSKRDHGRTYSIWRAGGNLIASIVRKWYICHMKYPEGVNEL